MALSTPWGGISYPELPDAPNGPVAFFNVANAIDKQINPSFSSATARDTAAALATLSEGMQCYRTDNHNFQYYNGTVWIDRSAIVTQQAADQASNTSTMVSSTNLKFDIEANGVYRVTLDLFYNVDNTAAGMKIGWAPSAGSSINYLKWNSGAIVGTASSANSGPYEATLRNTSTSALGGPNDNTVDLYARVFLYVNNGAVASRLFFQFSQNTTTTGSTHAARIRQDSLLSATRIG